MRQAVENCKTLLSVMNKKEIPIYAGADGPLIRGGKKELWPGHGWYSSRESNLGRVAHLVYRDRWARQRYYERQSCKYILLCCSNLMGD